MITVRVLKTFEFLKSKGIGDLIKIQIPGDPVEEVTLLHRGRQNIRVSRPAKPNTKPFLVDIEDVILDEVVEEAA